ncbi:MAG: hypothetical protein ACI4JT_06215 [Oscillospiraceae bacterium]
MPDNVDRLAMVMKPSSPRLSKILTECGYNAAKAGGESPRFCVKMREKTVLFGTHFSSENNG